MAPRYKDNEKVKGGVLRRSRRRARKLGREDVLKGGVTGAEARSLRSDSNQAPNTGNVGGGVGRRARARLEQIGPVGGVNAKDGITRPEARKVRRAYMTEQRFNPLQPRNGRQLVKEAQALTDREFDPQRQELAHERQLESGRTQVMAAWFQQYQDAVAKMARETQIANQAYQAGAYQTAQTAFGADTQALGQRQQQAGPGADQGVYAQAQQAAAGRLAQGNAYGNAIGQIGQAQGGLMAGRAAGAAQQRTETLADAQARERRIGELAQELEGRAGAAMTENIGKLKDSERQYALERQTFGLKVEEARAGIADDRADNRRQARKDRQTAARNRLLNQQTRVNIRKTKGEIALDKNADLADDGKRNFSQDYSEFKKNHGAGGTPSGFTPTQVRGNRSSFENGISRGRSASDKPYAWHIRQLESAGYDELMAKVIAWKVSRSGRVPAGLLRRFRKRYGFTPSAKGAPRTKQNRHEGSATPRNPDGTPG